MIRPDGTSNDEVAGNQEFVPPEHAQYGVSLMIGREGQAT